MHITSLLLGWRGGAFASAVALSALFAIELRRRHVRRRQFERRCTGCGETHIERKHLRIKRPGTRWEYICQTQHKCTNSECKLFGQFHEYKTYVGHFSVWRKLFHGGQFEENATPEDFLGPMRKILEREKSRISATRVSFSKPPLPDVPLVTLETLRKKH
jgi:hypothetical protein